MVQYRLPVHVVGQLGYVSFHDLNVSHSSVLGTLYIVLGVID